MFYDKFKSSSVFYSKRSTSASTLFVGPVSKLVWSLLKILLVHGYIKGFFRQKGSINIFLKQNEEGKGLRKIQQISRSKQRVYVSCKKLPTLENGLGLLILSTPKGVCTSQQAQKNRVGGEILCQVF